MRKLPGLVTHSDITLSRGITYDSKLWEWREKVIEGAVERHDISITLLDDTGSAKITWNLFDCWPRKWTGPEPQRDRRRRGDRDARSSTRAIVEG